MEGAAATPPPTTEPLLGPGGGAIPARSVGQACPQLCLRAGPAGSSATGRSSRRGRVPGTSRLSKPFLQCLRQACPRASKREGSVIQSGLRHSGGSPTPPLHLHLPFLGAVWVPGEGSQRFLSLSDPSPQPLPPFSPGYLCSSHAGGVSRNCNDPPSSQRGLLRGPLLLSSHQPHHPRPGHARFPCRECAALSTGPVPRAHALSHPAHPRTLQRSRLRGEATVLCCPSGFRPPADTRSAGRPPSWRCVRGKPTEPA